MVRSANRRDLSQTALAVVEQVTGSVLSHSTHSKTSRAKRRSPASPDLKGKALALASRNRPGRGR